MGLRITGVHLLSARLALWHPAIVIIIRTASSLQSSSLARIPYHSHSHLSITLVQVRSAVLDDTKIIKGMNIRNESLRNYYLDLWSPNHILNALQGLLKELGLLLILSNLCFEWMSFQKMWKKFWFHKYFLGFFFAQIDDYNICD